MSAERLNECNCQKKKIPTFRATTQRPIQGNGLFELFQIRFRYLILVILDMY